jgi:hypothetical protein
MSIFSFTTRPRWRSAHLGAGRHLGASRSTSPTKNTPTIEKFNPALMDRVSTPNHR